MSVSAEITQSLQKFAKSLQCVKKEVRDEVDFLCRWASHLAINWCFHFWWVWSSMLKLLKIASMQFFYFPQCVYFLNWTRQNSNLTALALNRPEWTTKKGKGGGGALKMNFDNLLIPIWKKSYALSENNMVYSSLSNSLQNIEE